MTNFKALVVRSQDKTVRVAQETLTLDDLMAGDVVVKVQATTINFKDALGVTGRGRIFKSSPMIPGVDLAGEVISSQDPRFITGDQVIVNGFGMGESHFGAYAEVARVPADWLLPMPKTITPAQAMSLGTAGYTAALCLMALEEQGLTPSMGEVLVSGATGGVGSIAVMLLAKAGYSVTALTGKPEASDYLRKLGAKTILPRSELSDANLRPLQSERWAGMIDTAGSTTLANGLAQMQRGGIVAATGLAQGMDLPASVAPFILRGVRLIGVDSVYQPLEIRSQAWARLARDIDFELLASITTPVAFADIPSACETLMAGSFMGRYVVDMGGF